MWTTPRQLTTAPPPTEESGPLAEFTPLTGHEPKLIDDFHYSEITEIIFRDESSDTRPSYLHDAEISDDTIGRALSSPLFTQEREEPADRRQACHSLDESLLSSQSLFVGHVRTGRLVSDEFGSLKSNVRENPRRDSENLQILKKVCCHLSLCLCVTQERGDPCTNFVR